MGTDRQDPSCAVFAEAGNAWDDMYRSGDLKRSIGAEVRLNMDLAYQLPRCGS